MSKSAIPAIDEIKEGFDIPVFEVSGDLDRLDGPVIVEENDMDALRAFAKAVGAKVILVQYDYADMYDYYINETPEELGKYLDPEELEEVNDLIDKRNCDVEEYFQDEYDGEPVGCAIYVNYEGTAYGIYLEDEELLETMGEYSEDFVFREVFTKMLGVDEDQLVDEEDDVPNALGER